MRALDRYFSSSPIEGDAVSLSGDEAQHLIRVMRARPGTQVLLFDGHGSEYLAVVERVDRSDVGLSILERRDADREISIDVVLAVSLPKGDRQKWLVEKAVELGVRQVVPLRTSRSVAQPVQQALERLERTVIEASKQCGRNRLMQIGEPQVWPDFVSATEQVPTRLLAHPDARPRDGAKRSGLFIPPDEATTGPVLLAVGPEGGFTAEEVALATAAGWRPVDLGPRILRVETAAILLAAMVAQHLPGL
jgi:16S rRNA (uracil1498-N3)-methyltransferase